MAARESLEIAAKRTGVPQQALTERFLRHRKYWVVEKDAPISLQELRRRWFDQTLREVEVEDPTLVQQLVSTYSEQLESEMNLFQDVIPALDSLSGCYDLGIISDGYRELQGRAIRRFNLDRCCWVIVLAEDLGVQKPDRRIFEVALEKMNRQPKEAVYKALVTRSVRNQGRTYVVRVSQV